MPTNGCYYRDLFREMLRKLANCHSPDSDETEQVSRSFWIAVDYWEKVKMQFLSQQDAHEITFFKHVKPRFTAYIQFYTILSEALYFVPQHLPQQLQFWQEEGERPAWFEYSHSSFIHYMSRGDTHSDKLYFSRLPANYSPEGFLFSYDNDLQACSLKDRELSSWLAYQRYDRYCQRKLKEIRKLIPIDK